MVSERQKLARKRFKEANPELFQKPNPPPRDPNKKSKNKIRNKKFKPHKGGDKRKSNIFRKHPLRVPGMKPGESCFICKAQDHIAKLCPKKSEWEKNKICLLCRRRGHSLKNCPNKNDSVEKKYCYNCGEVGHSLSNCSHSLQDGGTKFANCFICNESGHLSKNCPKSTHGIYPKGGSCKICGGVTHLAKECPNKGNRDTFAAGELGNNRTSSGYGERWQGQITKFVSGDDLDDDFITDDAKNGKKDDTMSHQETYSVSVGVEAEKNIKPKKKQGPKVVNFMG